MKRTALTAALFLGASLLGSQAFAVSNDKDLCAANLQTVKDATVSTASNLSASERENLETTHKQAVDDQGRGDDKGCIEKTSKAIAGLKRQGGGDSDK